MLSPRWRRTGLAVCSDGITRKPRPNRHPSGRCQQCEIHDESTAKRKTLHSQLVWKARAVSRHDSRLAHRLRKHIMVIVTGRLPSLQGMCSVLTNNPYYRWSFYYFDYDFHQSIVPGSAGCAAPGDACALKSALSPIRACAAGARNVANRLRDMTDCQSAAGCSCRCGASRPIFATRPFCSVWGWLAEDAKYAKDE